MEDYTVGIDLGTTNTVCCTFEDTFSFIKCKRGYILPSVMLYKDGSVSVGDIAKQKSVRFPENVISSSKTYMGDFSKVWNIEDRKFTATDVAAEILNEVNRASQKHFNTDQQISAVITVPAYFTASQYDETKKAAEMAGLKVINIISEPVAAAIASGIDDEAKKIFVVDIGGGTFDICLLEHQNGVNGTNRFTTKYVDGDKQLGGDDFDKVIVDMCYSQLRREYGIDFSSLASSGLDETIYSQAKQKIIQKSEQAKVALSDVAETFIEISNLCEKNGNIINFKYAITRQEFERNSQELLSRIKRILNRCINDNQIITSDIDKVILVGGSAYIPAIRSIVQECFSQEPYADGDLSKLVAMGAALCASQKKTLVSTKLVIEDILSHSLGIRVVHDRFDIIMKKGRKYPASYTRQYTTVQNFQEEVSIQVYEGECTSNIHENTRYGIFSLKGIRSAPAGVPNIKVKFEITSDRQLIVTAWDEDTGAKNSITIKKG